MNIKIDTIIQEAIEYKGVEEKLFSPPLLRGEQNGKKN